MRFLHFIWLWTEKREATKQRGASEDCIPQTGLGGSLTGIYSTAMYATPNAPGPTCVPIVGPMETASSMEHE